MDNIRNISDIASLKQPGRYPKKPPGKLTLKTH